MNHCGYHPRSRETHFEVGLELAERFAEGVLAVGSAIYGRFEFKAHHMDSLAKCKHGYPFALDENDLGALLRDAEDPRHVNVCSMKTERTDKVNRAASQCEDKRFAIRPRITALNICSPIFFGFGHPIICLPGLFQHPAEVTDPG